MVVHREPHSKTASDSSIYMDYIVGANWKARAWHTDVFSTIPTYKPITSEKPKTLTAPDGVILPVRLNQS